MPFKSDKQRRYLWSQKPEVAKKFAEHKNNGGAINYEDPILLNELKKKMEERVAKAKAEGIGVTHEYMPRANYRANYGQKTFRANPGSLGRWNSVAEWKPVPGRKDWYDLKDVNINVPLTPSLTNAHTIGEEYAHAKEQQKLDDVHKNTIMKTQKPKANYAEEMRAKKAADEFIGGYHTPRSGDWVDYTRESYRNHYVPHMGSRNVLRAEAENQGVLDEASYHNKGKWIGKGPLSLGDEATDLARRNLARIKNTAQPSAPPKLSGHAARQKNWGSRRDKVGEDLKDIVDFATDVAPVTGIAKDIGRAVTSAAAGDLKGAALNAGSAGLSFVPGGKLAGKAVKAGTDKIRNFHGFERARQRVPDLVPDNPTIWNQINDDVFHGRNLKLGPKAKRGGSASGKSAEAYNASVMTPDGKELPVLVAPHAKHKGKYHLITTRDRGRKNNDTSILGGRHYEEGGRINNVWGDDIGYRAANSGREARSRGLSRDEFRGILDRNLSDGRIDRYGYDAAMEDYTSSAPTSKSDGRREPSSSGSWWSSVGDVIGKATAPAKAAAANAIENTGRRTSDKQVYSIDTAIARAREELGPQPSINKDYKAHHEWNRKYHKLKDKYMKEARKEYDTVVNPKPTGGK